jgi:hypothetical protein
MPRGYDLRQKLGKLPQLEQRNGRVFPEVTLRLSPKLNQHWIVRGQKAEINRR